MALKEANTPAFKKYAKQVIKNADALAKELTKLGWRIVSGGTDTHLVLVDTWMDGKGISGAEASDRLEKNGIIVNKNTIPGEKDHRWIHQVFVLVLQLRQLAVKRKRILLILLER